MEKVSFVTGDDVMIVGNYLEASDMAVLLLHMMPSTKESFGELAEELQKKDFSVLAIDLRGHGESTQNGKLNYKDFNDVQHKSSSYDVKAAIAFLKDQGASTISIIGASIGANLALQYQAEHPEIKKTILLSPGLNYRGLHGEEFAKKIKPDQEVYIVAGSRDGRSGESAADMANAIAKKIRGKKVVQVFDGQAHGTDLLEENSELRTELVDWLLE